MTMSWKNSFLLAEICIQYKRDVYKRQFLDHSIFPSSGISLPVMIFINVDFPSPLAPTKPTCSPLSRRKETSVKMALSPKPWLSFSTFKLSLIHIFVEDGGVMPNPTIEKVYDGCQKAKENDVDPVSYTHLDVYKRQLVYCPILKGC